jgi:hypothetical protein
MRKIGIALGCLVTFTSGWALGNGRGVSADGAGWKGLGGLDKAMYVAGYLSGFVRAETDMAVVGYAAAAKGGGQLAPTPPGSREAAAAVLARVKQEDWPLLTRFAGGRNAAAGQVVATMDTFYRDYGNAPVCWHDALMFSAASLAGRPPTEQVLNEARVAGAKRPCGL